MSSVNLKKKWINTFIDLQQIFTLLQWTNTNRSTIKQINESVNLYLVNYIMHIVAQ